MHLSAKHGLVSVTQSLLDKGASVVAVDASGLSPVLACAPNLNVAQCLALILATSPSFSALVPLRILNNHEQKGIKMITIFLYEYLSLILLWHTGKIKLTFCFLHQMQMNCLRSSCSHPLVEINQTGLTAQRTPNFIRELTTV